MARERPSAPRRAAAITAACVAVLVGGAGEAADAAPEVTRVQPDAIAAAPRHVVVDVPPILKVVGPSTATAAAIFAFNGATEPLRVGVASYDTVELELHDWPFDEVMFFLEGELDITSAAGVVTHVRAGDVIVVPKGFNGRWRQLAPIKKVSVIYDGAGFYAAKTGK